MSAASQRKLHFIGFNGCGEMGLGHKNKVHELTKCKYPITKIYPSNQYTIFSDDNFENIWCAGYNHRGQCGVGEGVDPDGKLLKLDYFQRNKIKIKKICVSSVGNSTFFITEDNELYGCGNQLGFEKLHNQYLPENLSQFELHDVVDAKSSNTFSIVLCRSNEVKISQILQNWCRLFADNNDNTVIPDDIISVIMMFSKFSKVYTTTPNGYGVRNVRYEEGWKEIESLSQNNIIKITAGANFSLYLDSDGIVYAKGNGYMGKLGLGHRETVDIPTEIKYFKERNIKIVDIASGYSHSLALDINGRLYAWGKNTKGECGGERERDVVMTPKMVQSLKEYEIDEIRCGYNMSYCRTKCGKDFIWGQNDDNECLTYDIGSFEDVYIPRQIDVIIKEKCEDNISRIVGIYPGYYLTYIVVE